MMMQDQGEEEVVAPLSPFTEHGQTAGDTDKSHNTYFVENIFLSPLASKIFMVYFHFQPIGFFWFTAKRLFIRK